MVRRLGIAFILAGALVWSGCGDSGVQAPPPPPPPPRPSVTVSPTSLFLSAGSTQQFAANTAVQWTVEEGAGGGTITANGLYQAPPTFGVFHVVATSTASPSSSAMAQVVVYLDPVVTSLSPAQGAAGGQAFTLTVNGSSFENGASVFWNGNPQTTAFVSSSQLTAAITPADLANAGDYPVGVVNPGSPQSNTLPFHIDNPQPTITSLTPSAVAGGSAPFTMTVTGGNFFSGATVLWNGSALLTAFTSGTALTAAVPAGDVAAQGSAQVSVINPSPNLGPSVPATFTIDAPNNAIPTIVSLSDTSAPAGWPGFPLTVSGTDFVSASSGQWNGANRPTLVLSGTQLKTAVTLADLAQPAVAQVTVFNPAPAGGVSNGVNFTISPVAVGSVGVIERSSIATDLTESDGDSWSPSISADARFVAFVSYADALVAGDTNGVADTFLRDTCIGAPAGCVPSVTRVSVASDGMQANGASIDAAISANGRYVAFSATATNLVPGGTSGNQNMFVRDTCLGAAPGCAPSTSLVSADDNASYGPSLSADGRYIAFNHGSFASNCGSYCSSGNDFVTVVRDTCAGAAPGCGAGTSVVSLANDGSNPNVTDFLPVAAISGDGRYVAFTSMASNLVANDTNNVEDAFLRDTCAGAGSPCTPSTQRVSLASDGSQISGGADGVSISGTGRLVAFTSVGITPGTPNSFVRDTCLGAPAGCLPSTIQASLANDGSQGNGASGSPNLSPDGRYVVFVSEATNLVANDNVPFFKIFLRDTCFGAAAGCGPSTALISVALGGTAENNGSDTPALNGDARYAVFVSNASNLAPGDTNQVEDVFVARTNVP